MKVFGFVILLIFYSVYICKMLIQKRKGIRTDQIAKGKEKGKELYVELVMKIATYCLVPVEVISIFLNGSRLPEGWLVCGIVIGLVGDAVFFTAVWTMKDSWRAGIAKNDKTELVTGGIYQISRNPAFLGFDLVYMGLLLMFFNWVQFLFAIFAMLMLHMQILQEEKHLTTMFGEKYMEYADRVCRYFGRKLIR